MLHKAIDVAQPGDVIVAEVGGDTEAGIFGEIMALAAKTKGIAGLVINGSVRDIRAISAMQFPVFAAGVCMTGTGKDHIGYINHPLSCAGVIVHPGDIVVGDDDGVVVLPRNEAETILEVCKKREEREHAWKRAILAGTSTMQLQNLGPLLASKGLVEE